MLGVDYLDPQPAGRARSWPSDTGVTYPLLADPDGQLRTDLRVRGPARRRARRPERHGRRRGVPAGARPTPSCGTWSATSSASASLPEPPARPRRPVGRLTPCPPAPARCAARVAGAGTPGSAGDHRRRADPLRAARGRPHPRGARCCCCSARARQGPDLLLTERAHDMRSHPGQVVLPRRLDRRRPTPRPRPRRCGRPRRRPVSTRPASRSSPRCRELWLPPSNFAVTPVLGWWREESAGRRRRPGRGARRLPGADRRAARPGAPGLGACTPRAGRARAS